MAEIKISDLTPKGANLIATDLLVVSEDIGGGLYETKSITGDEVLNAVAKTAVAVRNTTGATIYKGTIVYISGTSGGKALISKAQANSEATSSKTLGVVTADIANNANGNVLTNGLLTLLDTRTTATHPFTTNTLAIGDDLYLSPTTAGYVTNVKPIAPNNLVNIGKVLETSATTGQILYAVVNGYELGELHDVDTTGAVTGNVLALDGSVWKPTAIPRGITIGTTPITSGVAGRVLFQNGGDVVGQDSGLFWDNTNKNLGIGTTTPATGTSLDVNGRIKANTISADNVNNTLNTVTLLQFAGTGNRIYDNSGAHVANIASGNFGIGAGTATPAARLEVRAQGALSTDIALRVRNSADNADLLSVNGAGNLNIGLGGFIYGDTTNPFIRLNNNFGTLLGYGTNYFNIGGAQFNFHTSSPIAPIRYRAHTGMRIHDNNQNATDPGTDGLQAILALTSTTRGFLPPRMTNAQRIAIVTPAVGLIVYCTDSVEGLYINKSTGWTFII